MLTFVAVVAGCLGAKDLAGNFENPAETADLFAALADDLPCEAQMHDGLTDNLRVVAGDAFPNGEASPHREIENHRYADKTLLIALRMAGGGFDVLDITDPVNPSHITSWASPAGGWQDMKFTTEGSAVVYSNGRVLEVVDMRDPLDPRVESTYELARSGAHMLATWNVDGREFVSISKAEGADVSIFGLSGAPGSRTLERVAHPYMTPINGVYPHADGAGLAGDQARGAVFDLRSHDTWFEVDPLTGTPLLWVANAYWGVAALDVSDPAEPTMVFSVLHEAPFVGYAHTAQVGHVDGRRYVVAVTEYGAATMKVWDATDLDDPKLVARWQEDVPTKPNHNIQVVGPYVYVAHFYDGLYIFDMRMIVPGADGRPGSIEPMAHIPADLSGEGITRPRVPAGYAQAYVGPVDVIVQDGLVWVSEEESGVHSYAFGCITPGDETQTSTG